MTIEQVTQYNRKVDMTTRSCVPRELAVGFLRYEALRTLNARQYAELSARNLKGEAFDDMVDALVVKEVTP